MQDLANLLTSIENGHGGELQRSVLGRVLAKLPALETLLKFAGHDENRAARHTRRPAESTIGQCGQRNNHRPLMSPAEKANRMAFLQR